MSAFHKIENVSVIGAGIMGSGIANSIIKYGYNVKLYDKDKGRVETACKIIKQHARRGMDPEKLQPAFSLEEAVKGADLVIEAVFEDLELKCRLFKTLGNIAPPHVIFASNTSSLNISLMAEASGRADRFVGLHFFNPALIMRLVEIITPLKLDVHVLNRVAEFIRGLKKEGVICKESPGFVVNRILIPVVNEAFYLLEEKIKGDTSRILDVAIDMDSAIVKDSILLMGIFNLADMTGLDTVYKVADVIYDGFKGNPRYKPAPLLDSLVLEGRHGRKNMWGIYYYDNNRNDPDLNPCLNEQGELIEWKPSPVFDTKQIIAVIVNEAFRVMEEGIVSGYTDIETSMELGTRWPKGPMKLAAMTGLGEIKKILEKRYAETGAARYEISGLFYMLPAELKEFFSAASVK